MDIRQLRYFTRIIELKSFTRAAESLRISQPALGLHVRNLEEELQTQLLIRHSRGVEPTRAGELLVERASRIIRDVDETNQMLRDFSGPLRGKITIGITPSTNAAIAVSLIERCAADLPQMRIGIVEALSSDLVEWTQCHRVDLALVYYVAEAPKGIVCENLGLEDLMLIQSAHGNPALGEISFAEAVTHPLIMPSAPHGLRGLIEEKAAERGLVLNVPFEMQAISVIAELVERKVASTILPVGAVAAKIADGRLIARKITEPTIKRTMSIIRSSGRAPPKAETQLRALIGDIVKQHRADERRLISHETAEDRSKRRATRREQPDQRSGG